MQAHFALTQPLPGCCPGEVHPALRARDEDSYWMDGDGDDQEIRRLIEFSGMVCYDAELSDA